MFLKCLVAVSFALIKVINCGVDKPQPRFVPPPPPFAPPLLYPINAATGILVAIAIPVPLHEQSVFVSYNFEGNYNMPNVAPDSFPGPIDRWTIQNNTPFPIIYGDPEPGGEGTADDVVARKLDGTSSNTTAGASTNEGTTDDARKLGEISSNKTAKASTEKHKVERRSSSDREIFTRRGAYQLIESRLDSSGINGKKCLLLAICESASISFVESNGVIGHVLHVILTPSSSMDEKLPTEYNKAESLGKSGDCRKYLKHCNFNILNVLSKVL